MMSSGGCDRQLIQIMANFKLQNFHGNNLDAGHYFFLASQKLIVTNMFLELDIYQNTQQIERQQKKLNHWKDIRGKYINDKPKNVPHLQYPCTVSGCGKIFPKKTSLSHHHLLKHLPYQNPHDAIFTITITPPEVRRKEDKINSP